MKITKVNSIALDTDIEIKACTLSAPNELVMLMSSGDIIRYNINSKQGLHLFSVKTSFVNEDGGFDVNAHTTIYTLDSIVVIVNDYKLYGFVHYPGKYKRLGLYRKDYHAEHSGFPIALYKNEKGVPHLIYGQAWNHVQIMNLDTRQILTAAKSLIEEGAEERYLDFQKRYGEDNKFKWPSSYDYFYDKLQMSPSNKYFLSAGWIWGSRDAYTIYEVQNFIDNNRIVGIWTDSWEHDNRAVCWIDEETVAIAYSPYIEEDEGATEASPQEIHFYGIEDKLTEIKRKVQVKGLDLVGSDIYFNNDFNAIVYVSTKVGAAILSLDGEILFYDEQLDLDAYHLDLNLFMKTEGNSVIIYKVEK